MGNSSSVCLEKIEGFQWVSIEVIAILCGVVKFKLTKLNLKLKAGE